MATRPPLKRKPKPRPGWTEFPDYAWLMSGANGEPDKAVLIPTIYPPGTETTHPFNPWPKR